MLALHARSWLLALLLGIGLLKVLPIHAQEQEGGDQPAQPPVVTVAPVEERPLATETSFIGRVEAIRAVDVRAQVSGFVEDVAFEEGALVEAGDLLVTLDARRFAAAARAAEARLAGARASAAQARQTLARQEELVERQTVSEAAFEDALAASESAEADVAIAEADLQSARLDVEDATVEAPISGKIGAALLTEGAVAGPQGQPLARIVQLDPIRVVFALTEGELVDLRQAGPEARGEWVLSLRLPNGTTYAEEGRFDFIGGEVDPSTGTVPVRVEFANPDAILLPGQFVTLVATEANPPRLPVVPSAAVLQDRDGRYVFVLGDDDKVARRDVRLGSTMNGVVAVEEGLEPGEVIVVQGLQRIGDNQQVQARREDPPADEHGGSGRDRS
ncbi:efflux RND transporter periplasmic adaptor subunit [Geminicoccus harenae]|uniref:efflux RND transporter periplasmic adaptor subunit n=1 Tax=Geminicoccus harenae TaxID=2498453 RepID=UPI00168BB60B|nr:efflux RND transporter periplasmic adaptor subunit [Geminicoccus harenae]